MTPEEKKEYFLKEVARVINTCSMENISNTPDFLLAENLWTHFVMVNDLINKRANWYGGEMTQLSHKEVRDLLVRYKERTKEMYESDIIKIKEHGGIQLSEDGAFVECSIWIPKEELE